MGTRESLVDPESSVFSSLLEKSFSFSARATRILQAFLSRFKILKSSMAILWISSLEKRSLEKFSMGPSLSMKLWSDPILRY